MNEKEFTTKSKYFISDYITNYTDQECEPSKIYTVWLTKVLQNNKGLFSTPIEDGRYYEVTFNGDKHEFYIDAYIKEKNIKLKQNK